MEAGELGQGQYSSSGFSHHCDKISEKQLKEEKVPLGPWLKGLIHRVK